jgi:hypothetical protein
MSKDSPITQSDHWFTGEDRTLRFSVVDADGLAQNISGWTLEWVLRERPWGTEALISKTTGAGITITNAAGGVCEVAIADDDTINLAPGAYVHTLRRSNAGAETVLAFGDAVLQQPATR